MVGSEAENDNIEYFGVKFTFVSLSYVCMCVQFLYMGVFVWRVHMCVGMSVHVCVVARKKSHV